MIAYTSIDGSSSEIWVVQADGAFPVKLTANGAENGHPVWSPDGRKIVFESDKDGTRDIWIMNADGSLQVKVLSSSGVDNNPKFSPTGDQIVFSRTKDGAATFARGRRPTRSIPRAWEGRKSRSSPPEPSMQRRLSFRRASRLEKQGPRIH